MARRTCARQATDLGLDVVEQLDARERLGRDRRVAADIDLVELAPEVAPAVGERHRTAGPCGRGQLLVDGVAVDLQDAVEAVEQLHGVLAAAAGRVGVGDRRRIAAAPWSIVAGDRPEKPVLVLPRPGSSTGQRVSSQNSFGDAFSSSTRRSCSGCSSAAAAPTQCAKRRAIDVHAVARQDLRLPIKRKVIGVLGHHDVGDQRLGRQAALDQPRRRRRLDDAGDVIGARLLARPAGVLRPPRDDHAHLGRNLVEPLRRVLADDVQLAAAARAHLALGLDHDLLVRQMIEALVAAGTALPRALGLERRIGLLVLGLGLGERGLEVLERERELIVGDALGLAAEVRAADLGDDGFEPLVARGELVALGSDRIALGDDGGMGGALGQDQRAERVDVVGQRVACIQSLAAASSCRRRARALPILAARAASIVSLSRRVA